MKPEFCQHTMNPLSRREALASLSAGFGFLAFAGLTSAQPADASKTSALAPRKPDFEARAKRVIFLCMRGGPSHVDTLDYKPRLKQDHERPSSYGTPWMGSPWEFKQHGDSGLWISELLPNIADHADELCLLRGMHCDQPAHAQAMIQMHTGNFQFVRPSVGAWSLYGLGTEIRTCQGSSRSIHRRRLAVLRITEVRFFQPLSRAQNSPYRIAASEIGASTDCVAEKPTRTASTTRLTSNFLKRHSGVSSI